MRFLLLSLFLLAQDPPKIARYVPPGPDAAHVFVLDAAHILSAATIAALQDSARALQTETGADVAWVTLPTLGGRPIEEAALYIGRTWRIGSAGKPGDPLRNRGLVILYVPDRTKTAGPNFRIEVGNGLEGTITDSKSRTITAAMRDDLRAKRYDAAYLAGWGVAAKLVREDAQASRASGARIAAQKPPESSAAKRSLRAIVFVVVVAIVAIGVVIVVLIVVVARSNSGRRRGASATSRKKRRRNRSSAWIATTTSSIDSGSSSISDSSSSGGSGGGDFGGGGGFSGGGSSDTI
jgi:uncharacterized protein